MAEIEKLDGKSMDIVEQNIEQLKALFPSVFSEGRIQFNQLEELLGNYVIEDEDHYNFTWHGKRKAGRLAQTPSTGTLRPCKEESVDWDTTENIFIEGDNLEVLKLLQKSYHRQIKMVYIDPPYNTGNDFVYEDDFKDGVKNYLELTGQLDGDGKKVGTNASAAGRIHTNWLNMMYPRLKLARNLMRDDGVIFISIDDNEQSNLRKLCNEVFGAENFIAVLPTIMNLKGNPDAYGFSDTHEYTLVYSKNKTHSNLGHFDLDEEELDDWLEDEHGLYKRADTLRRTGQDAAREKRPKGWFPVFINSNDEVYVTDNDKPSKETDIELWPATEDGVELSWTWSKKKIKEEGYNLIVIEGRYGKNIYKKQRPQLGDLPTKKPKTIFYKPEYSTSTATTELKRLLERKIFDGPKPVPFIRDLIKVGMPDGGVLLDFFSGSGTSAHALMELGLTDDDQRQHISVQLPEVTDEKSEAFKAGFKNIAEISKERIRRAAKKIKDENPDYNGDLGFKVFKLDSSNIKRWDADFDTLEQDLVDAADYLVEGRSDEDVLYELCLKLGLDLSVKIEEETIAGEKLFVLGRGYLVVCLSGNVTMDVVNGIGDLKDKLAPEDGMRVVFKDDGFKDDVIKTNALQTLKRFGITDIKSL